MDWSERWRQQMQAASFRQLGDTWHVRAEQWNQTATEDNQASFLQNVLGRMDVGPNDSVLDVGCGNGLLSIPLAKRAGRVTALDQATAMVELTRKNAAAAGVDNIVALHRDWTRAQVGVDVEPHDVVLSARSVLMLDLKHFLLNLDQAALKRCYLVWWVGEYVPLDAEVAHVLGEPYTPQPSYILIYNMLYDLGICADVQMFTLSEMRHFPTLEQGVASMARTRILDDPSTERLKAHFAHEFTLEDGLYTREWRSPWTVLSWGKGGPYRRA
jgi:SAM-dependent methyltransferase